MRGTSNLIHILKLTVLSLNYIRVTLRKISTLYSEFGPVLILQGYSIIEVRGSSIVGLLVRRNSSLKSISLMINYQGFEIDWTVVIILIKKTIVRYSHHE